MGGGRRRSHLEVCYAILRHAARFAERARENEDPRIPKSRLQYSVYISWSRLDSYLKELSLAGLIDEDTLLPTRQGLEFIREFQSFQGRLVGHYGLRDVLI